MYKLKGVLVIVCFLFISALQAQQDLDIQGISPDLYLLHTVSAKETWYSIGRLYNISAREIAVENKTTISKTISIGQQLKIPLVKANFSQDGLKAATEVFVPVYHTVQDKEWMYRISQNNNKVPMVTLEKWNNITNDKLRPGMRLVVGYLKVKTGQSALAARGTKKITPVAVAPVVKNETVAAKEEPVLVKNDPPAETKKPDQKETVTTPSNTNETKEPVTPPQSKAVTPPPPVETKPTETATYTGAKGGYFRNGFSENGKNATGNAGVFRSTSGWKDGKYYALMNDVPVGTIIKVTFPSTTKSVYAKVLGELPDMRESVGLTIRISDAAAAELGAELGKFYVDVKY